MNVFDATRRAPIPGVQVAAITALISGVSVFVNSYGVHAIAQPAVYTTAKNLVAAVVLAGLALGATRLGPARVGRRSALDYPASGEKRRRLERGMAVMEQGGGGWPSPTSGSSAAARPSFCSSMGSPAPRRPQPHSSTMDWSSGSQSWPCHSSASG